MHQSTETQKVQRKIVRDRGDDEDSQAIGSLEKSWEWCPTLHGNRSLCQFYLEFKE
jgi:hypothetical protein